MNPDASVKAGGDKSDNQNGPQTAKGRYDYLFSYREPFLLRARAGSKLTIPSLIPPLGHNPTTPLPTPYQSLGARGVNTLASKLLLALFPPNSPFFRLMVDSYSIDPAKLDPQDLANIDSALAKIERAVMVDIETGTTRVSAFEALKHLIVGGNVLVYETTDGGLKVYHLEHYVVRRDTVGDVLEIITEESIDREALPDEVKAALPPHASGADGSDPSRKPGDISLYTWVKRVKNRYVVHQEVAGVVVPKSQGSYPLDKCPWIPLRFTKIDGEDYGRGYVEEYFGDLQSLEGLSRAVIEGAAAASKQLWLVDPNSGIRKRDLVEASNGDVIDGSAEGIKCLQMEKYADFKFATETIGNIQQRLEQAFMLNSSVQRDAERVTAEEIQYMASELDNTFGGTYSILSQEFQLPYVNVKLAQMQKAKRLPQLPKGVVKPAIVTGLEAIGRGQDLGKLNQLLQTLQPLGPEVISQYLNVSNYITRAATSLGIDTTGLIKSDVEVQQAAQQQQAQQAVSQLGPHFIKAAPQMQKNAMEQQAQQQAQQSPK